VAPGCGRQGVLASTAVGAAVPGPRKTLAWKASRTGTDRSRLAAAAACAGDTTLADVAAGALAAEAGAGAVGRSPGAAPPEGPAGPPRPAGRRKAPGCW